MHLQYIEKRLDEYSQALAGADDENKKIITQQIERQNQRKEKYLDLGKQLIDTEETQVSTSDLDSRQMITRNNITEVAYNVQTTVDAKNNLTLDFKTQSLSEVIHGKADEATIQSCTQEVELIQKMITNRKENFSPNSFP